MFIYLSCHDAAVNLLAQDRFFNVCSHAAAHAEHLHPASELYGRSGGSCRASLNDRITPITGETDPPFCRVICVRSGGSRSGAGCPRLPNQRRWKLSRFRTKGAHGRLGVNFAERGRARCLPRSW